MKELDRFPQESLLSQIEDGEKLLKTAGEENQPNKSLDSPSVSPWVVTASATLGGLTALGIVCATVCWVMSDSQPERADVAEQNVLQAVVVDHIDGVEVYESNEVVKMRVKTD